MDLQHNLSCAILVINSGRFCPPSGVLFFHLYYCPSQTVFYLLMWLPCFNYLFLSPLISSLLITSLTRTWTRVFEFFCFGEIHSILLYIQTFRAFVKLSNCLCVVQVFAQDKKYKVSIFWN